MNEETIVADALVMLEQMTDYLDEVLAMDPEDQRLLLKRLQDLLEQVNNINTEADLLYTADAVQRIVEDMPRLRRRFVAKNADVTTDQIARAVTLEDYAATRADGEASAKVQAQTAQIRNHVVVVHDRLKEVLDIRKPVKKKKRLR